MWNKVLLRAKVTEEHYKETKHGLPNRTTFNNLEWPLTPNTRSQHFSTLNIQETTRDATTDTAQRQQEIVCSVSTGDISNDLHGPRTLFSRSRHFWSRLNRNMCILGINSLKHTNRKPYANYRMVPLSMTFSDLWPPVKVKTFFDIEYLWNDTPYSRSYCGTSIGSHMRCMTWWHFKWPSRTTNYVFKVTAFVKLNIS